MGKLQGLLKLVKKEQLILCFLFGILLLVIALPTEKKQEETSSQAVSENGARLETQLEEALMKIDGIGVANVTLALEPLVDNSSNPQIRGVLVVASSGDNPVAVRKIQETVMTLFQLEAHKIIVMKMK